MYQSKQELHLFFNALAFMTRIPVPQWVEFSDDSQRLSSKYFPWIGLLVGAVCALTFIIAAQVFTTSIAVILSMMVSLLITGAFHEDGLADACDGFGGGWKKDQVLSIMKDSRIGTYGAIALAMSLLLKFESLTVLSEIGSIICILLLSHTLSRLVAVSVISTEKYARTSDSKVKSVTEKLPLTLLLFAGLPSVVLLLWLGPASWPLIVLLLFVRYGLVRYFRKRLDGYTGDCLGAVQQVSELAIYLYFCLPFIALGW